MRSNLLKEFIKLSINNFLIEGKIDDLARQYNVTTTVINQLAELDPTPQRKYLPWIVKQIIERDESEEDVHAAILTFHKNQIKLKQRDITQYKSTDDLLSAVKNVENIQTATQKRKSIKATSSDRIYEDDNVVVIFVKDKKTSCQYGKGTQWCISATNADTENLFDGYAIENEIFYFIIRKQLMNDSYDKIAVKLSRNDNGNVIDSELYDVTDDVMSDTDNVDYGQIDLRKILSIIKSDAPKRPMTIQYKVATGNVTNNELYKYYDDSISGGSLFDHIQFFALFNDPIARGKLQKKVTNQEFLKLVNNDLADPALSIKTLEGPGDWAIRWADNDNVTHRDNGPAVILHDGNKTTMKWYNHGLLHRIDGPAITNSRGDEEWYVKGDRHRDRNDGPAVIRSNGKLWYERGVEVSNPNRAQSRMR